MQNKHDVTTTKRWKNSHEQLTIITLQHLQLKVKSNGKANKITPPHHPHHLQLTVASNSKSCGNIKID